MDAVRAVAPRAPARPTLAGLVVAGLCWWASLYPTLIPHDWLVQAMVSGVAAAIGYGIGGLAGRGLRLLNVRPERRGRLPWIAVGLAWLVTIAVGSVAWPSWQNDLRDLVEMPHVGALDALVMAGASVVVAAVAVTLGRWIAGGLGALHRLVARYVPAWLSAPATLTLLIVLVVVIAGPAMYRGATVAASALFAPTNAGTFPGNVEPVAPTVSGSPDSLVTWDSLGRQGREFTSGVTTREQLEAFHGPDAELTDPVRAYIGLDSGGSSAERAALAVRELERAGGFEREVLAVWIPTGTGWVEQNAARALEMLHAGDTAIVSMQYSYLPSLLAVFLDAGGSIDAGLELYGAVHARWEELPVDDRPLLVMFGMSLGTAGVEAPFAGYDADSSLANMAARTDGALIVGSKFENPMLTQLTDAREPGSPVWQPVVDGGETARFVTRAPDAPPFDPTWEAPRVVYLQHPSDPVTYWGIEHLWSPPEWMDRPRGHDVSEQATWFPIISSLGSVADLVGQLSTPPGFGHVYDEDYLGAWARVVPPAGWTDADTDRLHAHLFPDDD